MPATTATQQPATAEPPRQLNGKVSQQVSDILAEAQRRENAQRNAPPPLAYRVPAPGVRYYF